MLGLLGPLTRLDGIVGRQATVSGLRERLHLLRHDVAGHHHDGVVGRIEALVEGERVFTRQLLHFVHPADDRDAVGVVLVQRRRHLLGQDAGWIVLGARTALFEDHLALGRHVLGVQLEVDHAVGLHLHHRLETLLGDALKVSRIVVRGEGVVLTAHARDGFGELARRDLVGRFEHQVLEEMGDTGYAGRPRRQSPRDTKRNVSPPVSDCPARPPAAARWRACTR